MPSTPSPLIKAELQVLGEGENVWGDPNLNNALKCLEEASKGCTTVTIGASDVTLISTNYTPTISQHYRYATLKLVAGGGVGARNIIVPGLAGQWVIHNTTAFTQTVKTTISAATASIGTGEIRHVYCDGTDCYSQSINISGALMTTGTLTGALNWASATTLASAGTVAIGAALTNYVIISGTTGITAFDAIAQGAERIVRFLGALTITHNATSLILPGGASITTVAGDIMRFISEGGGNWRCTSFTRNSTTIQGGTLAGALNGAPTVTLASAATVNIGAAASNYINIINNVTITAFDTIAAGAERTLHFLGPLTLTHNATSLILPGGTNFIVEGGDVLTFVSEGSGNWRCTSFARAGLTPRVAFSAHKNSVDQSVTSAVYTKVTFGTAAINVGSFYSTGTSRFTPPAGYYRLSATLNGTPELNPDVSFYKNGVLHKEWFTSGTVGQASVTAIVSANGTDYFEVYTYNSDAVPVIDGDPVLTWFDGEAL